MLTITRTGKKLPFLDVGIGCVYFAHGAFWTRTDYNEGTQLNATDFVGGSACDFLIDGTITGRDGVVCEEVEAVTLSF